MSAYKPGTGCRGSLVRRGTARRYELCKSVQCHVPALGVAATALSEELASSDFFYSPDRIGGNEKANGKKEEEEEEERKAEVGFCSKRCSS
jgi:hypothetical protein